MGGIGAILAIFVLLTVAVFQIAWFFFKTLLQISIWTVTGIARLLSLAFALRQNRHQVAINSKVKRSAPRRKK